MPFLDEPLGELVELFEIIRGVELPVLPIESQPADVLLDRLDVFDLLGFGVRVVEAEVAFPAVVGGQAEIEADRLGVADVEIAVRLGREAGLDPALVLAGFEVGVDDVADEIVLGFWSRFMMRRPSCVG